MTSCEEPAFHFVQGKCDPIPCHAHSSSLDTRTVGDTPSHLGDSLTRRLSQEVSRSREISAYYDQFRRGREHDARPTRRTSPRPTTDDHQPTSAGILASSVDDGGQP